jgi:uncharacterized protein YbaP (TraB family)
MSIFYKITAPNGRVSSLFGTIHQNDEAYVTLPLEVKRAFEQATDCVFEADIVSFLENPISMFTLAGNWIASQAQYLNQIPKDYILSAKRNFKIIRDKRVKENPDMAPLLDMMMENIKQVPPLQIAGGMMAGNARQIDTARSINGLDQQLIKYAKLKNKKTGYLESPEDQLIALQGYNLNILEQIELYRFIESELAKGKKFPNLEDTERAYQQQDIQKLSDVLRVFPTTSSVPESVRRYYDGLGINRDLKMAERMKSYLDKGNAFVAVGAGHLKEVTDKLQTEGYTIEAVSLGKRYYPIEGTIEDGEKVAAFRKIYTALYMAQTSFFKKRGFVPIDDMIVSLKRIQDYTTTNKDTRSYKAWELAEKHYKNISSNNSELLKSICQEGYAKSSSFFGLFRRTKTNLDDAQSVAEASVETRTGSVRDILNGSPI